MSCIYGRKIKQLQKKIKALEQSSGGQGESLNLATVATTGDYNDLENKPNIPDDQVQSNWNETNTNSKAYIQNKPTIPTVPDNVQAAQGGTTLSVVTTGDKYNWNNKASVWRGSQADYELLTPDPNTIYIIIPQEELL